MKTFKTLLIIILFFAFNVNAAEENSTKTVVFKDKKGQAIKGFDTVSYFEEKAPLEGKKQFSFEYANATWLFANEKNLELFKQNPEKYAPQYGGWCAYGVAHANDFVETNPKKAYSVVDGKLYLNYDQSVKKLWEEDTKENIKTANTNWPALLEKGKK